MRNKFSHIAAFVLALFVGMSLPLSAQQSPKVREDASVEQRGAPPGDTAPAVRQTPQDHASNLSSAPATQQGAEPQQGAESQDSAPAAGQQDAANRSAAPEQGAENTAPMVQLYMAPSWQPPQELEDSFHLYVGETRVIKLPSPVLKTAIGNGKVISTAMVNATDLLVIASDAGRSMIHLWFKDGSEVSYAVEVGLNSPAKTYAQVRDMLAKEENINITLVGNRVFLQAQTLKPAQVPLIGALQKAFPDQIVLITGNDVALDERTVYLTAQLVEIKRNAMEKLGVQWAETIHGPAGSIVADASRQGQRYLRPKDEGSSGVPNLDNWQGYTNPFQTAFSLATVITSKINLLRNEGDAYIVAEPRLTARCGGKADFTSGGEMPIPVQTGLGATNVEFKEYGVRLAIEPKCDKLGNIRAKVSTEVSQIDTAVAVMGVPGLLTRKAMSELDLQEGQSMLLSGLASYKAGESEDRVPYLGRIPLLGHLFKNNNTNGERSELIVIITPSFISPDSDLVRQSVERRKQLSGETEGKLTEQKVKPLEKKESAPPPNRSANRSAIGDGDLRNILYAGEAAPTTSAAANPPAPATPATPVTPTAPATPAASATQGTTTAQASAPPPAVTQKGYSLKGDVPWRPKSVWDDGQRTVIEMPEDILSDKAPTLLIVKPSASMGNRTVKYRMEGARYLVDGLFDSAVLVAGSGYYRQTVMIERQP